MPGLALCAAIGLAAYALSRVQSQFPISPMMLAIVLALALSATFGAPAWAREGQAFTLRRLLRLAIVLLGFQLTVSDVGVLGVKAVAVILCALALTFFVTRWMGRLMGVDPGLSELIASGTSICGASAIVATNSVTRAPQEDVFYSLACITFFGTIAMFALPALYGPLGLTPTEYGLWAGGSIHEVAQVVAAGFQPGQQEGETAMIAKLLRVAAMAPMILWLGATRSRGDGPAPPIPWFVVGFAAVILLNSALAPPLWFRQWAQFATIFMLTMSLAALGLGADIRKLRLKGPRPLALGGASTLFITLAMLTGIWLIR
ncbi:MAG: YeiH family protein [Beijerinckiaceae bacterium]|nr:YeiH family protein [Beijerinckiaceae bacterium]